MIPRDHAKKALFDENYGIQGCAGFDKATDEVLTVLINTVAQISTDEMHGLQVVREWTSQNRFLPSAADLREIAEASKVQHSRPRHRQCPFCRDSGYESFWALFTAERWPSGDLKRMNRVRLPPDPWMIAEAQKAKPPLPDDTFYLSMKPRIVDGERRGEYWEAVVDGIDQWVEVVSARCSCGRIAKTAQEAA